MNLINRRINYLQRMGLLSKFGLHFLTILSFFWIIIMPFHILISLYFRRKIRQQTIAKNVVILLLGLPIIEECFIVVIIIFVRSSINILICILESVHFAYLQSVCNRIIFFMFKVIFLMRRLFLIDFEGIVVQESIILINICVQ